MKKDHPELTRPREPGWLQPWTRFWFSPIDPIGLHALRVLTGLILLLWLLPLAGQADALFGLGGWIDKEARQQAADQQLGLPRLGLSLLYLAPDNAAVVQTVYWASIVTFVLFTLGIAVRVTSILTWVAVYSFLAGPAASYDADYLLLIPTFYLMIGYVFYGQLRRSSSLKDLLLGPRDACATRLFARTASEEVPSHAANFAIRLIQIHFAIVVVASFLHKLNMPQWWAGVAFFFPLYPPYATTYDDLRALAPMQEGYFFVLSLAQYIMLAWQFAFPFFAWKKNLRILLLGGGVAAWIGSVLIFGLPLFGPIFFMACLSYLTPEEWRSAQRWLLPPKPATKVQAPRPRPAIKEAVPSSTAVKADSPLPSKSTGIK